MSYRSSHYDRSIAEGHLTCRHCESTLPLYTDHAAGDIICTECGVVSKSRIPFDGPEWRDFNTSEDLAKGKGLDFHARAGGCVDESRWIGGLEPTRLGMVYGGVYGHGTAEGRLREATIRRKLLKTDRVVEKWMEKQFERKVEESRLAMTLKRKRDSQSTENPLEDEEDWTSLGTNDHDEIVRQREEAFQSSQVSLVSEKWSLDRALLLHGTHEEIPCKYRRDSLSSQFPLDLEQERKTLKNKMDISQRKASEDLYRANRIISKAICNLDLIEGRLNLDVMQLVSQYANTKGGISVKGISKIQSTNGQQQQECNKARMAASLGSAFIYLICKRDGLQRTVERICTSFEWGEYCQSKNKPLIKNKDLSSALKEIQKYMPEYVSSTQKARIKAERCPSTSTLSSLKMEESIVTRKKYQITDLVQESVSKLNLPPITVAAVSHLVSNYKLLNPLEDDSKLLVVIASMTFMVCEAGGIMQRLASQEINQRDSKNYPTKTYTRPSVTSFGNPRCTGISSSSLPTKKCKTHGVGSKPFEVVSHSAIKEEIGSKCNAVKLSWSKQPAWKRGFMDIAKSCHVPHSTMREFYRRRLHPHRKKLLSSLSESFLKSADTEHGIFVEAKQCFDLDIMMENIVEAHRLMAATPS